LTCVLSCRRKGYFAGSDQALSAVESLECQANFLNSVARFLNEGYHLPDVTFHLMEILFVMGPLVLKNIKKSYYSRKGLRAVLDGIDLTIPAGQFVVILGPSGCGKTTLLKIVAGLVRPDENQYTLTIDGRSITGPGPERNIVFQAYTSFPWLTALENVRFGLQFMNLPKHEQYKRAEAYLEQVGLSDFRNDFPRDLSGGQQQRIAIARTLAAEPEIVLMDEPFASLDAQTRETMQADLVDIWERTGRTILFVTHDIAEAAFLGERVLVLSRMPARVIYECSTESELEKKIISRLATDPSQRDALSEIESITGEPSERINVHHRGDWVRQQPEFLALTQRLKSAISAGAID
jgi:NitT/TauT family transport system ATP-binding protein